MNKLIVSGNLVRDIDLRYTQGTGMAVIRNTIAAKRKFKDKATGKYESDFIPIIAFGKTAEFISEHFGKGEGIQVEAHMQSGSYTDKDGNKRYTLEAVVENVEFMGKAISNNSSTQNFGQGFDEDIMPINDGDIPF